MGRDGLVPLASVQVGERIPPRELPIESSQARVSPSKPEVVPGQGETRKRLAELTAGADDSSESCQPSCRLADPFGFLRKGEAQVQPSLGWAMVEAGPGNSANPDTGY